MKSEYTKMIAEELYNPADEQLAAMRLYARQQTKKFNESEVADLATRQAILKDLLGTTTDAYYIEPPFHCDYGKNIHWGHNAYANFNLVVLDVAPVHIGDNVMIAPNVTLATATHPIVAHERNSGLEYAKAITIGNNVWLGAQVVVNPGVKIGENSVIGAGSVVTKDIPANVIAVGNPCRVLRPITEADLMNPASAHAGE